MNIVERAKNIILKPNTEWDAVVVEQTSVMKLYTGYIAILAAIPAVATFIQQSVIGIPVPIYGSIRMSVSYGLKNAIVAYVLTLVGTYVSALVISALASSFGGVKNDIAALKLVAYAWTPGWVAGIFNIIPSLSIIGLIASFYGLYLLFVGLPKLMKSPQEKSVAYVIVSGIVMIVVYVVIGVVVTAVVGIKAAISLSDYNW
jgi:hypothetical protein